jgi:hypothetical protein
VPVQAVGTFLDEGVAIPEKGHVVCGPRGDRSNSSTPVSESVV